jgi:two-component system, NtrC family, sensor kinase
MKSLEPALIEATSPTRLRSLKALGVASVIAPAVVFGAYALISYDAAFRRAEERASHLTVILQDHAQRVFEAIALALSSTRHQLEDADDEAIRSSRPLWDQINRTQKAAPQLGSIFVIAADGSSLLTTRDFPTPETSFHDRDYYVAQAASDAGLFIGQRYIGKISNEPIFNFSIRRYDKDGRFAGVIGSSAYVDYFREFYASVGEDNDDFSVLLLRSDGEILVRHPRFDGATKFEMEYLRSDAQPQRQIKYAVSPVDGLDRLYASAKVGNYPIFVTYSISQAAITRQWGRSLAVPGAVTIGISIALCLLTSFAFRRARREGVVVEQLKEAAKSLEAEIDRRQKVERSLQQAQKLDAIGRLAGGIAHDFNNLLMIISGNLSLAQRRDDLPAVRRLVGAAKYAADRGAGLTRQLLTFSRAQGLRPVVVDLNEVLANARSWISRTVMEAIEIRFVQDDKLWPVRVDVAQFEAVLLNLVVNARDAMNGAGTLVISARNICLPNVKGDMPTLPHGDYVAVSVSDTGSGMTQETLAKVFEPFFTTKEPGKGTGLGLSQVHGFIHQTGGDISIETEVGRGTTVTLYMPRSAGLPEVLPAREDALEPPAASGEVVLVVEDEDEVRRLVLTMLLELGYSATAVRTAPECLALLGAQERVDVLLTDIVLPRGITGIELAEKAQSLRPGLTIILMTASLGVEAKFPVLAKPFDKDELLKAVRDVTGARRKQP